MAVRQTINQLTAARVRTINQPGKYADGAGLFLRVVETSGGGVAKSWVFRYRLHGKQHDLGLGKLATWDLAEARERAKKCRQMVHEGQDPVEYYQQFRKPKEAAKKHTFAEAAEAYIATKRKGWHPRHVAQWESTLRRYAAPIAQKPVDAITMDDVRECLASDWTDKPETLSRVRQRIERVLDAATSRGWRSGDNPARFKGNLETWLPDRPRGHKAKPRAAMAYTELSAFLAELRGKQGFSPRALEFQVLTATRPGEASGARWDEIDLDAATWVIPGARMKMGEEHRVPLSTQAVALLRSLPQLRENPHVFPGEKRGKPLTTAAAMKVLKTMRPGLTAHGFRSTFRTWCAEVDRCPRDIAESALAHTIQGVEGVYNRSEFLAQRAALMQRWADYCDGAAGA